MTMDLNAAPSAHSKPVRPKGTLGLKRAVPSALASAHFASPSRAAHTDPALTTAAPSKRARLVLPTQQLDADHDQSEPLPLATVGGNDTPPSHAFLLGRKSSNQGSSAHATNNAAAGPSSGNGPFYLCTWRKPQQKKHKTWDGDAILVVKDGGERCSLICSETGKELVTSARFAFDRLSSGDELALGGKEIEIDREIEQPEYRRLIAFTRGELSPIKKGPPPTAIRTPKPFAVPIKRSAIKPVDINQIAPARAETFYGKTAPKPIRKDLDDDSSASPSRVSGLSNPGQGKKAQPRFDPHEPGAIVMKRPDEGHQHRHNPKGRPIVDVVLDPQLTKALRPHQIEGVKFLYERVMGMHADGTKGHGAILADEMGLGKTLQTIALVLTLMKQSCYYTSKSCTIERAIIVCPLTLVKNWKREFRKWIGTNSLNVLCIDEGRGREDVERFARSRAYHVMVIGYEKLRSCIDVVKTASPPVDLIVCDEGHRLKSKDAQTTQMFEELKTERRIILSGTPIQNNLSELYAMIDFVSPALLGTPDNFKALFEEPIVRSRAKHASKQTKAVGQARLGALTTVTKDIILRRTAEILTQFLPPKKEMVLFCSPSQEQVRIYQSILGSSEVRSLLQGGGAGNGLLQIGVLRKLCNSPELLLKDTEADADSPTKTLVGDLTRFFPPNFVRNEARFSGKLICVMNLLETVRAQTDDKVVLVSNFTSTLDIIEAMMRKKRYPYLRLDGKTPQDERMAMVNQFNREGVDNSFVFLLSAKSGGVGLNLIGANRLVLIDSDWNPSTDLQAMARIHRDGQRKTCYIYRLLLSGTMDEKIYQRQISKLGLSDSLMNAEKKSSSSDTFSPEELRDIFTLHLDSTCISHRQLLCDCDGKGGSATSDKLGPLGGLGDSQSSIKSEDEDELPGFVAASQHVVDKAAQDRLDRRKKLLALYKWAHYDCVRHPDDFDEDEIAAGLVRSAGQRGRVKSMGGTRVKAELEDEWSSDMKDREDDRLFLAGDEEEMDGAAVAGLGGEDEFRLDEVEAGRILFVFAKNSDRTVDKASSPSITTSPALD
ncbi:hypothetical protein PHSY_003442 [Pseudozyma hubeiensis SY62]|uniref:Uncharacterized protein n=1 Tax=Pseudozyma hubeiensis (strain SY62) TaxID=1305764 RepID=R9PCT4_PSEHS|nr:hypothetical protein PHSY_003442 [Pseudozyma hubeiensis SY62]GAC95865.1 hypothetical protein PHSY_003442 [Pseudozyma hubeiensis SY62]